MGGEVPIGAKSLANSGNASGALLNNFMGLVASSAMSSNDGNTQRSGASIRSKRDEREQSPLKGVPSFKSGKKQSTSSILQNANQRAMQTMGGASSGEMFTS